MKLFFVIFLITLFISCAYLGIFFSNHDEFKLKTKISKHIFLKIFPILAVFNLLIGFIYFCILYKDMITIILILLGFSIIFFSFLIIDVLTLGAIAFSIFGITLLAFAFFYYPIKMDESKMNISIPLYNTAVTNDDLTGVIIQITPTLSRNYYAKMQYNIEEFKESWNLENETLPTELVCDEFKLVNSDECKLVIKPVQTTQCTILSYHGFTSFTPEVTLYGAKYILYVDESSIEYV